MKKIFIFLISLLLFTSCNSSKPKKTLAAFGEASIPGQIIKYLEDEFDEYEIEYYESANEAGNAFVAGKADAVILAEPFCSVIESKTDFSNKKSIQDIYYKKSGYTSYPQAGIFVKKELSNFFLDDLMIINNRIATGYNIYKSDSDSLKFALKDINIKELGFNDESLIINSYRNLGINPLLAINCKDELNDIASIMNFNIDDSLFVPYKQTSNDFFSRYIDSFRDPNYLYSIIVPNGATVLSLLPLFEDEEIKIDIVTGGDLLQASFLNKDHDIIVAPINMGLKVGAENYRLLSIVTWGNLYLLEK